MRSILILILTLAGCTGVHVPTNDGGTPTTDAPGDFCRELYGHQVNAGGRLGIDRADWPCPAWVTSSAQADQCVAFLQIEAGDACEVESCEACP
jgi:hypothetical protein